MASDLLRTNDIAKTLGIHANTVRNYEKWGYLAWTFYVQAPGGFTVEVLY